MWIVAAEGIRHAEADIVEQDDQDIGGARPAGGLPVRGAGVSTPAAWPRPRSPTARAGTAIRCRLRPEALRMPTWRAARMQRLRRRGTWTACDCSFEKNSWACTSLRHDTAPAQIGKRDHRRCRDVDGEDDDGPGARQGRCNHDGDADVAGGAGDGERGAVVLRSGRRAGGRSPGPGRSGPPG